MLVKDVAFDPQSSTYAVRQKSLSDAEWNALLAEAAKYSISEDLLRTIVADIDKETTFSPQIDMLYSIDPSKIKVGQHLKFWGKSETHGMAILELMCIARNRFLVLDSGRHILQKEDIVASVTMPWNAGYVVDFNVIRNGRPYPDSNHHYRTRPLEKIELLNPAVIYEFLDRPDEDEEQAVSQNLSGYSLIINDLQIAALADDNSIKSKYGEEIQCMGTVYLKARILYTAFRNEKVKLGVNLYDATGKLRIGKVKEHTFYNEIELNDSGVSELSGLKDRNNSYWPKGEYRYEVWIDNNMLISKSFVIQ
jgi:hypothetical protein